MAVDSLVTNRHPRILCLGMTAIDYIWQAEALPGAGVKTRANDFSSVGGGMAATAAVAVARLGGQVQFWGRAGKDVPGRLMREELAGYGVDVSRMRLVAGARSSVSGVFVDHAGERMIANFRGDGLPADTDWLPWNEVAQADAVLADVRWLEGAQSLFTAARRAGVPTVLDGDATEAGIFDKLLPLTDYAIFSAQGLSEFAGHRDALAALAEAASRGSRVAVVTQGERGLVWFSQGRTGEIPAISVKVADTTGAGDVFHGAFAFAIGGGAEWKDALRFSSAVAALKCTKPNGRFGIPTYEAVIEFMQALPAALSDA